MKINTNFISFKKKHKNKKNQIIFHSATCKNNKTIEKNVELNQKVGEFTREGIINDVSSDLAETETEKLKGLAEGIEYKDADSFRKSIETLKDSYFPKAEASDKQSNEVADNDASPNLSESMAAYTAAISKTKKNPYLK